MSQCFRNEVLEYDNPLFLKCIDSCYIITMDGSDRRENYIQQLDTYRPYKKVNIIHNKGYKKCTKDKSIQSTADDLSDVYAQIFYECLQNNNERVLILEDDFFFTEQFELLRQDIAEIESFILNTPKLMTYNLGAIPWIMHPCSANMKHYWYKGCIAHSVIYSQAYMTEYIKHYKTMSCLSDTFWNKYKQNYCFYKAICFQLFPRTENSKIWSKYIDFVGIKQKVFDADKTHEHLYPFMYNFAKSWYMFVILFIIYKVKYFKKSNSI